MNLLQQMDQYMNIIMHLKNTGTVLQQEHYIFIHMSEHGASRRQNVFLNENQWKIAYRRINFISFNLFWKHKAFRRYMLIFKSVSINQIPDRRYFLSCYGHWLNISVVIYSLAVFSKWIEIQVIVIVVPKGPFLWI